MVSLRHPKIVSSSSFPLFIGIFPSPL